MWHTCVGLLAVTVSVHSDAVGIVPTYVVLERIMNAYLYNKRTYTHAFDALQYVHAYVHGLGCIVTRCIRFGT
jgi:hypothetical protein